MKYTQKELESMLAEFRASPAEPSWLEFKTGLKDPVQIAKYISGLANVAAYAGSTHGYLVWGVQNETHELVGTDFDPDVVLGRRIERDMAVRTDEQKRTKVGKLLSLKMKKRMGWIDNIGSDKKSVWILTDIGTSECKSKNPSCKRKCKRICKQEGTRSNCFGEAVMKLIGS